MSKQIFRLVHAQARQLAKEAIDSSPDGYVVRISEPTRSLEQNSLMWASLVDVANQVVWHGRKLTSEEWKYVFSAVLKKQEAVPGIDGGFVILGNSTSKMSVKEMAEMIDLIHAFGAEHGVKFGDYDAR